MGGRVELFGLATTMALRDESRHILLKRMDICYFCAYRPVMWLFASEEKRAVYNGCLC